MQCTARLWLTIATLALVAAPALAIDVSGCSTTIEEGQVGTLVADLDCTGYAVGVRVTHGATLQLNGHRISGADQCVQVSSFAVVVRNATVAGPGELTGCGAGLVTVSKVTTVTDVDLHDNTEYGIQTGRGGIRVDATNVVVRQNGESGFYGGNLRANGFTATGNGENGIEAARLQGDGITADGNALVGIAAQNVKATGVQANGNGRYGITATKRVLLFDSTLTGNGYYDILSLKRPVFRDVTCDHSTTFTLGTPWGVCAAD